MIQIEKSQSRPQRFNQPPAGIKAMNYFKIMAFTLVLLAYGVNSMANPVETENSLVWKIEGKNIQTSYIFGTFHLISENDFHLSESVKNALQSTDRLILELDMDDPGLQQAMMQHMQMPAGTTLDKLLDKEAYAAVDSVLKATAGAGLQMMNTFKPFVVASMLIGTYIEGNVTSYEMVLMQMAKNDNKEVLGIETVEEQMTIFDSIPYQQQADDLAEMVLEREKSEKLFAKMIKLYKDEDFEGLYDMMEEYYETDYELRLLLDKRNQLWQKRLPEMIREKSAFIAVGAGHMGGENGIIPLLKKAGYKVTPVN